MTWFSTNWFNLLQTVSIIATLIVAVSAVRSSTGTAKATNTLALITSNREIWGQLITDPSLQSVIRPRMSPGERVRYNEKQFVKEVIHHSFVSFEIAKMGGVNRAQGVRRDIHDTMTLPVFKTVWDELKVYQSTEFVKFIDSCIAGIDLDKPFGRESLIERITAKLTRIS